MRSASDSDHETTGSPGAAGDTAVRGGLTPIGHVAPAQLRPEGFPPGDAPVRSSFSQAAHCSPGSSIVQSGPMRIQPSP